MPDEELNEQEQETQEGAAPETEAAPSNFETPAFDPAAARAEIESQLRAEFEAKYRPQETPKPQEDQVPDRYLDPEGYDAYREAKLTEKILSQVAPLLGVVRENTVEQRFRQAGVGDAGMELIRKVPGLDPTQLNGPAFEILTNAAKYADIQKQTTPKVNPERPYGARQSMDITEDDRKMYGIGTQYGPTEAEVRAWKKEEMEANRR